MKLYRLECLTEEGTNEINGYFIERENAELIKKVLDSEERNLKFSIKQRIVEFHTED